MLSAKRILWATLGTIGLLAIAASFPGSALGEPTIGVTICAVGGAATISGNRAARERWQSLRRLDQALLATAWYAILVAAIVFGNRRLPMATGLDVRECAAIPILGVALFSVYRLFSKSMDALWARLTRR
ncbi:MAG TPA: hypothetical protein VIY53_04040 [Acidobacteriaceae bacterium]